MTLDPAQAITLVMDMKLELVAVPVTDVDRAKSFYGIRSASTPTISMLDRAGHRHQQHGTRSQQGLQVVVTDIEEAKRELEGRGVATSAIDDQPWGRFIYFSDPDGNCWSVQQIPPPP